MAKVITLTGLQRLAGDSEPPLMGGNCASMGAHDVYGDNAVCVFPVYRHPDGCEADGLTEGVIDGYTWCVPQSVIDEGIATTPGGPIGGDCRAIPGCMTKKYLIAAGIGAGAGLLLGLLGSKKTGVRVGLAGVGAGVGALGVLMMGLRQA